MHPVGECGDRVRRGKVHGGGAGSPPLGGDHHNTVRCASSVESSCRGIFQHLHTFNIVWIDKVERVVGHTGPGFMLDNSGTGVANSALIFINPNDIERMEGVKDASAAPRYEAGAEKGVGGVRAKRGRARG